MLKPKPWWLKAVTGSDVWVTTYPDIYYPEQDNPDLYPALIAHETVHLASQKAVGVKRWLWYYFTSKRFRFDEEVTAMRVELTYRTTEDRIIRTDEMARQLSSRMYFWCSTYDQAMAALIVK
jgi:hypothetical protein